MSVDDALFGTDIQALNDLPDPEVLCSGDLNVAYALARRLSQDSDAMAEVGDTDEYDAINLADWLGGDFDLTNRTVIDDLQQQCKQVLLKDPRVLDVRVQASYTSGTLNVSVAGTASNGGPFSFILPITSSGVQAPFTDIQP
jgi:hypothetical protein